MYDFNPYLGQNSTTKYCVEYLMEHGAGVSENLKEWQQIVIACALRGRFNKTTISNIPNKYNHIYTAHADDLDALTKKGITLKTRWQGTLRKMIIEGDVDGNLHCDLK